MILSLDVSLQLRRVEVHIAKVATTVAPGLIVKVRRLRMAALATGRNSLRPHAITELDDGDEAVPARAVPFLGTRVRARSKRCQRAPAGRWEGHGDARFRVVERLNDAKPSIPEIGRAHV